MKCLEATDYKSPVQVIKMIIKQLKKSSPRGHMPLLFMSLQKDVLNFALRALLSSSFHKSWLRFLEKTINSWKILNRVNQTENCSTSWLKINTSSLNTISCMFMIIFGLSCACVRTRLEPDLSNHMLFHIGLFPNYNTRSPRIYHAILYCIYQGVSIT